MNSGCEAHATPVNFYNVSEQSAHKVFPSIYLGGWGPLRRQTWTKWKLTCNPVLL